MTILREEDVAILRELIDIVNTNEYGTTEATIPYADLAGRVNKKKGYHLEAVGLSPYLERIGYFCEEHKAPIITAVAVRKGENEPGNGMYGFPSSRNEFDWLRHLEATYNYKNWNKILELA